MTIKSLPIDVKNSDIEYCINEYVRPIEHREILYKHWFNRASIEELARDYNLSETSIKKILYGIGDKVLLKAIKMSNK